MLARYRITRLHYRYASVAPWLGCYTIVDPVRNPMVRGIRDLVNSLLEPLLKY